MSMDTPDRETVARRIKAGWDKKRAETEPVRRLIYKDGSINKARASRAAAVRATAVQSMVREGETLDAALVKAGSLKA